jgi:hypothetical protein
MTTVQSAKKVQDTVLIATRIHGRETTAALSFDSAKLRDFLHNTLAYADAVAVAVEVADPFHPRLLVAAQDVVKEFKGCRINVLPVTPWGHFVPALNASLSFAMQEDFSYILYLSLEMDLTPLAFRALLANFDPAEDLVVGAGEYFFLEAYGFLSGSDFHMKRSVELLERAITLLAICEFDYAYRKITMCPSRKHH